MKIAIQMIAISLTLIGFMQGCGSIDDGQGVSSLKEWQNKDVRKDVNMASYCKRKFGQQFNAAYLGNGEWVCQTSPHNRRPISVIEACQWQQNTNRVVFDQSALAWYCVVSQQVWVPVRVGVNMNAYCKRQYGSAFSALVLGNNPTVGDWVCSANPYTRKGISVRQACEWQQGTSVHGYTNYNDPYSWYCEK